jgi:hypothetical protein
MRALNLGHAWEAKRSVRAGCAGGRCRGCCWGFGVQHAGHPGVDHPGLRPLHARPAAAPRGRAGRHRTPRRPHGHQRALYPRLGRSGLYSVDTSGCVALPLIGAVSARGLTTFELAANIASLLKRKYLKDPQVTAEVETYRPFFVLGEVNRPGQYPYMNVETAVAIAEGYTERAKQPMVCLTRKFGGVMSTVMVPTDYPLRPGDTIYVLECFF